MNIITLSVHEKTVTVFVKNPIFLFLLFNFTFLLLNINIITGTNKIRTVTNSRV